MNRENTEIMALIKNMAKNVAAGILTRAEAEQVLSAYHFNKLYKCSKIQVPNNAVHSKIQVPNNLDRMTGDITDEQANLLDRVENGNCLLTDCKDCPLDGKYCI